MDTTQIDAAFASVDTALLQRLQNLKDGTAERGTFQIDITGNATTANKLKTAMSISASGDASGSVSFDGSANVSFPIALSATGVNPGTYNTSASQITPFTVDAKGRITSFGTPINIGATWANIQNRPTTLAGLGITGAAASGANADITSLQGLTTPLSANQGGTGIASYTVGDLVVAAGQTTLTTIPAVAAGNVLISAGFSTAPTYGKVDLTTMVSNTLPITRGGTGGTSQATAQANLGLVPGTNVQGYSNELTALSGLSSTGYLKRTAQATYTLDNTVYMPLGGGNFGGAVQTFGSLGAISNTQANQAPFMVMGGAGDSDAAFIAFRRPSPANGAGVYFGLDADNVLKVGGWGFGNHAYTIYHTGNLTPSTFLSTGGGDISGNLTLNNDVYLAARDASNTAVRLLGIRADNLMVFGGLDADANITSLDIRLGGASMFTISADKIVSSVPISGPGFYSNTTGTVGSGGSGGGGTSSGQITIGTTTVAIGASITTIAGMSSITSTSFVGALSGNATSASQLATARSITLTGDAGGATNFDGSANVALPVTLAASGVTAGTYPKVTVNTKGLVTLGSSLTAADIPNLDWSKVTTGKPTTLSGYGITDAINVASIGVAGGVAPLDGTGKVAASFLPSYVDQIVEVATFAALPATGSTGVIYVVDANNTTYRWSGSSYVAISSSPGTTDNVVEGSVNLYFTAARAQAAVTTITGNAATATKLGAARSISITGDLTWTTTFDGSANVSAAGSLAATGVTAGTYNNSATQVSPITVDAKGRVTSVGAAVTITPNWSNVQAKPTTLAGFGITDGVNSSGNLLPLQQASLTSLILTTTSLSAVVFDTFPVTTFRSAEYIIQATAGTSYQLLKLMLLHDGVTVYLNEFGDISTGTSLVSVDASITAGVLNVIITPTNASTTIKATRTAIVP